MKKILSTILITVLVFSFFACTPAPSAKKGAYTADGVTYFLTDDGAIKVGTGGAESVDLSVSGTVYTIDGVEIDESLLSEASFEMPDAGEEYFTLGDSGKTITGLTELGKTKKVLFAPKGVTNIAEGAFADGALSAFVIGSSDTAINLSNGAFSGTSSLDVYIDGGCDPNKVTCGQNLLSDTTGVKFYVGGSAYSNFKNHYNWGNFSSDIKKY